MNESTSIAVKKCTCDHVYQDKRFGKGMRLHNKGLKGWTCTVCRHVVLSS